MFQRPDNTLFQSLLIADTLFQEAHHRKLEASHPHHEALALGERFYPLHSPLTQHPHSKVCYPQF